MLSSNFLLPSTGGKKILRNVFLDPLHFVLAAGPLALYLLLLGGINLAARPLVTTGARDFLSLAIGVAGCAIAGPMELFFPESFAGTPWLAWLMLLSLYGMLALMIVLLSRPRLIVYNLTTSQLRPTLAKVVSKLDPEARWAGDSAFLPNLGVQFLVEPFNVLKNVQLVASSPAANVDGWRLLEKELVQALQPERTTPNPFGFVLTTFASLLAAAVVYSLLTHPDRISHSLETMLFPDNPPQVEPVKPTPPTEPVDSPPVDKPENESSKSNDPVKESSDNPADEPASEPDPPSSEPPADNP